MVRALKLCQSPSTWHRARRLRTTTATPSDLCQLITQSTFGSRSTARAKMEMGTRASGVPYCQPMSTFWNIESDYLCRRDSLLHTASQTPPTTPTSTHSSRYRTRTLVLAYCSNTFRGSHSCWSMTQSLSSQPHTPR